MAEVEINKIITLTGHKDCIYTVSPSYDPGKGISGGGDGLVAEWELDGNENGQLVAQVANSVYAVCPVPGTSQLIVAQNYEGIHVIDSREKKELGSLKLDNAAFFDMHYENGILYIGDSMGVLTMVNLDTLTVIGKIKKSDKSVRILVPNGYDLAVGYSDDHIRVFNLKDMSVKQDIKAHKKSVFALKYSPDNRYLLSGSRDAHLKIWDVANGYQLKESIVAHMYAIHAIDYSPDGAHFATCSMDKTIKIWDANNFKLLKVIDKARHGGHTSSVNKLFWSSYKNRLISCSDDRSIAVWEINFNTQP